MKYLIKQPAGIGDIFFLQKVATKLAKRGDTVVWPVKNEIFPLTEYIVQPNVLYIRENCEPVTYYTKDATPLEFESADKHFSGSVMLAKYKLIETEWNDWADYFNFNRNKEKEDYVYYDVCKLKDNDKFTFVNRNYGTQPNFQVCKYINLDKFTGKIAEMQFLNDITLFDWCKVIENATEIHTVETSLNYIIEKLDIKGSLNMYSKWSPPNYDHVKMLFKKPWKYNL